MENQVRCHQCGNENQLVMVAHRDKFGGVVGWIFVCQECFPKIEGREFETRVKGNAKVGAAQAPNTGSPKCRCRCSRGPVTNGQFVVCVDDSCPCHGAALRAGA
jgi:hypothetical protein